MNQGSEVRRTGEATVCVKTEFCLRMLILAVGFFLENKPNTGEPHGVAAREFHPANNVRIRWHDNVEVFARGLRTLNLRYLYKKIVRNYKVTYTGQHYTTYNILYL